VTHAEHVVRLLAESREREKAQTLFYRSLAADAELAVDADASERLNELHADEQHHLSRLTARLLELGGSPADLRDVPVPAGDLAGWEVLARAREQDEVDWYEQMLEAPLDSATRGVIVEILDSERHHHAELRGKWMSA
jgi:rubrerythrin